MNNPKITELVIERVNIVRDALLEARDSFSAAINQAQGIEALSSQRIDLDNLVLNISNGIEGIDAVVNMYDVQLNSLRGTGNDSVSLQEVETAVAAEPEAPEAIDTPVIGDDVTVDPYFPPQQPLMVEDIQAMTNQIDQEGPKPGTPAWRIQQRLQRQQAEREALEAAQVPAPKVTQPAPEPAPIATRTPAAAPAAAPTPVGTTAKATARPNPPASHPAAPAAQAAPAAAKPEPAPVAVKTEPAPAATPGGGTRKLSRRDQALREQASIPTFLPAAAEELPTIAPPPSNYQRMVDPKYSPLFRAFAQAPWLENGTGVITIGTEGYKDYVKDIVNIDGYTRARSPQGFYRATREETIPSHVIVRLRMFALMWDFKSNEDSIKVYQVGLSDAGANDHRWFNLKELPSGSIARLLGELYTFLKVEEVPYNPTAV